MSIIGGNLEKKEIGLPIGISGTHNNTEINKSTGFLQLIEVDTDSQGKSIYAEQGSWTSDVIDLEDKFQDFDKVFTINTNNGSSSFAVLTRVSDNGRDWTDWIAIAEDGAIQSDTKQYIQVRIDLFAGFVTDEFVIAKSDFEKNEYVMLKTIFEGKYAVPTLTSNAPITDGFPFSSGENSPSTATWMAFDKRDAWYFLTASGTVKGFLGFYFNKRRRVSKYRLKSPETGTNFPYMPKTWFLQGSNDTTNGINGKWDDLDTQTNQTWNTINTFREFSIINPKLYNAYRVNWSENNGYKSNTGIWELDFYEDSITSLSLNRDYKFDMTPDTTWSETGSLHKKKVTRNQWLRIDRMEVE